MTLGGFMKIAILNTVLALSTFGVSTAFAETIVTTVHWTENGVEQNVTMDDVNKSVTPIFGYVRDLTTKQNLCYVGKDYETVDLVYKGLNHHGTEICDSYFLVKADGTLVVGPCQQPSISPDFYSSEIPVCAASAPTPAPTPAP